jgi:hypothetical protein
MRSLDPHRTDQARLPDPLGLEEVERAAAEFRGKIMCLADGPESDRA